MKLVELKYQKIIFPLQNPIRISKQVINEKEVIIIVATDENGKNYFGEVGPLYGFSQETILECETQLNIIIKNFINSDLLEIINWLTENKFATSIKFGFEQIYFSNQLENSLIELQNSVVLVNGLVGIKNIRC